MSGNVEAMEAMLAPFGPRLALPELVIEVNRIYHDYEAAIYDEIHPEVHRQLPRKWQAMVELVARSQPDAGWTILDFGCGTGFEAELLARLLSAGSIRQLVCYDPSVKMLERCEKRVGRRHPTAQFVSRLDDLPAAPYNLLATNSLLHHLPDPVATITQLTSSLTDDAWWLAGHEPSSRFYRNGETRGAFEQFRIERPSIDPWWRKYVTPARYRERVRRFRFPDRVSPAIATARAVTASGLFAEEPRPWTIHRIVDFHVAHSVEEAEWGRGFDFERLRDEFAGTWDLVWHETYSFMGPVYEGRLPRKWARRARDLAARFPDDGANFCTVWKRSC